MRAVYTAIDMVIDDIVSANYDPNTESELVERLVDELGDRYTAVYTASSAMGDFTTPVKVSSIRDMRLLQIVILSQGECLHLSLKRTRI